MNVGIFLAIVALLGWGISKIFVKKLTDRVSAYTALLYTQVFVAGLLVVLSLFSGKVEVPGFGLGFLIVVTGLIGTLAIYSLYRGVKVGKVSIVIPIAHTFVIITVILGLVVLKEAVSLLQGIGIVVTIAGVLAVSFKWEDWKRLRSRQMIKGVPYALATSLGWGVFYLFLKLIVRQINPLSATLFIELTVFALLLIALVRISVDKITRSGVLLAGASGVLVALAAWSFNTSISLVPVAIVAPIAASSPFVTVVLARIFLKEKLAVNQLVAILLIIVGIVILSM